MGDAHRESCSWCQAGSSGAWALGGKRLGAHERRVLLLATPPGQLPEPIVPPGTRPSSQTATRRAVASLQTSQLIVVPTETRRVYPTQKDLADFLTRLNRDYAVLRFAIRTALGDAVVEVFGHQLKTGGRIRWTINNDELTAAVVRRCPHR